MKELTSSELDKVLGGDAVSGPILSGVVSLVKILRDAGYDLGSGIRRLAEDDVCPLR